MSKEVLNRHWQQLLAREGVLNVALGDEIVKGAATGKTAIRVYVAKKKTPAELTPEQRLPEEIEGVPVDVQELAPTTWTVGKTDISQLHPEEQLHKLGAFKPAVPPKNPKMIPPMYSQLSNLTKYASPVRNQRNCGNCVGNGGVETIEAEYRVLINSPGNPIMLSVDDAFNCSGGTCAGGQDVNKFLDYCVANYICTEACQPTKNQDIPCGQGQCTTPWAGSLKLKSYTVITDLNQMKLTLDTHPLIVVMAVHQSFFNYQSGKYQSLGVGDPIVGYHCVANFGHDEVNQQWGPIENSWDVIWGEKGFFYIAFGDSEIDQQMWQIEVDLTPEPVPNPNPNPNPGPTPSPCKWGKTVASVMNLAFMQGLRKRKGRFAYMDGLVAENK